MAIVELVGGYLADKAVRQFCSLFKTNVIERWSRKRARRVCGNVLHAVIDGSDTDEIAHKLDDMMADDSQICRSVRRLSPCCTLNFGNDWPPDYRVGNRTHDWRIAQCVPNRREDHGGCGIVHELYSLKQRTGTIGML